MKKKPTKLDLPKIIVITGPTASGKSNLAIKIALKLGGEIISADSRQVYKGMDIGTGKVTKEEQKKTVHHLLDVANPKKQFTASDFKTLGDKSLKTIIAQGRIPIIVGGTGFYIDILLDRIKMPDVPPNRKLRTQLDKLTTKKLFEKLEKLDPKRAKTIDRNNRRRLTRAIEICVAINRSSNRPVYTLPKKKYDILWLGINPDKEKLAEVIKKRLENRLKQGMVKEVQKLIKMGVSHKRLQSFGLEYRWLSLYLKDKISYEEMKEKLMRDIVRYSKRQRTWFKKNKEIYWIKNYTNASERVKKFIS